MAEPAAPSLATPATPRVAVVGSFMQAVLWELPHLPSPGETVQASGFSSEPAGKGLAFAVACRRLGVEVDLLLSIGDDAAGDAVLARLEAEALSTLHVLRSRGRSGHGAGWLSADGANAIAVYDGANGRLDAAAGGTGGAPRWQAPLWSTLNSKPRSRLPSKPSHAPGDMAPSPCSIPRPGNRCPRALLACTQVLMVNETEVARLVPGWRDDVTAGPAIEQALSALWAGWPGGGERLLVVTLGADGSIAFAPDGTRDAAPALEVAVHSSIGAGDAYAAGWCTARIGGATVLQSLQAGNACGAFAVSHAGILDALPLGDQIEGWV